MLTARGEDGAGGPFTLVYMVSFAAFGQFGEVGYLLRTVGALLILGLIMGFSPTTFGIEIGELEHAKEHTNEVRLRVMVIVVGVALAAIAEARHLLGLLLDGLFVLDRFLL